MKKITIVLLLTVLCIESIFSQAYYFKHYNNNSGLSLNTVMSIFQDSKGFIWIGTKNGLNRFDGHNFKIFQRGDSINELRNSMIFCITEDRNKILWLGTDQGISLYNPFTENFSNFNLKTDKQEEIKGYISKIFIDNQDRVWILAGNGLFLFNPTENKLYGLNHKFSPYSLTTPRALFVEKDGTAYIGLSEVGVVKYNINTDETTFLAQSNSIPTVICNYKNNYLLLGTMNKGLFLIDKQTGTCESIQIDKERCSDV